VTPPSALRRHDGGKMIRSHLNAPSSPSTAPALVGATLVVARFVRKFRPKQGDHKGRPYMDREAVLACAHFMNATSTGSARTSAGRNGRAKDRPASVRTRDNAT